jgi:hypothetical protein
MLDTSERPCHAFDEALITRRLFLYPLMTVEGCSSSVPHSTAMHALSDKVQTPARGVETWRHDIHILEFCP